MSAEINAPGFDLSGTFTTDVNPREGSPLPPGPPEAAPGGGESQKSITPWSSKKCQVARLHSAAEPQRAALASEANYVGVGVPHNDDAVVPLTWMVGDAVICVLEIIGPHHKLQPLQ